MTPPRPGRLTPGGLLVLAVAVTAALLAAGAVTPQPWRAAFFGAAGAITALTAFYWRQHAKDNRSDQH